MKRATQSQRDWERETKVPLIADKAVPDLGLRAGDALVVETGDRGGTPYRLVRDVTEDPLALREAYERGDLRLASSKTESRFVEYLDASPAPQRRPRYGHLRLIGGATEKQTQKRRRA